MKIYDLEKVPEPSQSRINFKAIRYLFLHFQHPGLVNQAHLKTAHERQSLLEQGLLSFTYHCDHGLVSQKAADVLSIMSSVVD
jgi:hypothetical protein